MIDTSGKYLPEFNNLKKIRKPMTPEEFAMKMWRIKTDQDSTSEYKHIVADGLMCDLLDELGYRDGVRYFEDMERWYS